MARVVERRDDVLGGFRIRTRQEMLIRWVIFSSKLWIPNTWYSNIIQTYLAKNQIIAGNKIVYEIKNSKTNNKIYDFTHKILKNKKNEYGIQGDLFLILIMAIYYIIKRYKIVGIKHLSDT